MSAISTSQEDEDSDLGFHDPGSDTDTSTTETVTTHIATAQRSEPPPVVAPVVAALTRGFSSFDVASYGNQLDDMNAEATYNELVMVEEEWKIGSNEISRENALGNAIHGVLGIARPTQENESMDAGIVLPSEIEESTRLQYKKLGRLTMAIKDTELWNEDTQERINRLHEILFYANIYTMTAFRMQMTFRPGYHTSMNNQDGFLAFNPYMHDDEEGLRKPYQNLLVFLLTKASSHGLRKKGLTLYAPKYTDEGNFTTCYERYMDIEEFVNRFITKESTYVHWITLTSARDIANRAAFHLGSCEDHQLPTLDKNRHVFSFRNGVYCCDTVDDVTGHACDRFYPYEHGYAKGLCKETCAARYFNSDFNPSWMDPSNGFDPMDIDTPKLQSIVDHQKYTRDESKWLYVFLGRLLFEVGNLDGWQVLPFFKGTAGTGKSTIVNSVAKNFYELSDVNILSNNHEQKFGLGSLYGCLLFVAPEISSSLSWDQAEAQSVISGEWVRLPRKYKDAISVEWKAPGVMAGNELPSWQDNAGSLQRRLVIFQFMERVIDTNTRLSQELSKEIPSILVKSAKLYLKAANDFGHADIWQYLPEKFTQRRDDVGTATNALVHFLASGKIEFSDDKVACYVKEKTFVAAFNEHCKENSFARHRFTDDYINNPLTSKGVEIVKRVRREWPRGSGMKTQSTFYMGCAIVTDAGDEDDSDDIG